MDVNEENGKRVEKPKYRPYDLRHFFASVLIEKKTNLKKIQSLMGLASIETTLNVYGHWLDDAEEDRLQGGLLFEMMGDSHGLDRRVTA